MLRTTLVWTLSLLCLAALTACGGSAVDPVTCGDGTKLEGGTCVPDDSVLMPPDPDLSCGEGTSLQNGVCVPTPRTCGEGTVLRDGQCVLAEDDLACGEGTVPLDGACRPVNELCGAGEAWRGGECVALSALCGAGTLWVDGRCALVDAFEGITNQEAPEPNDPDLGGQPQDLPLLEEDTPWRARGAIAEAVDTDGDGVLDADVDVFRFIGRPGERFRVEATSPDGPGVAFALRFVPALDQADPGFVRAAIPFADRNSHRELVLPFQGRYELRVGSPEAILAELGFLSQWGDPVGGEGWEWWIAVERKRNRAPQRSSEAAFETFGTLGELAQVQVAAPPGTLLRLELETESPQARPILWVTEPDYGDFRQGSALAQVGERELLVTVDHLYEATQQGGFRLRGGAAPLADLGLIEPDRVGVASLSLPPGIEGYVRLRVEEPLLLQVEAEAVTPGADPALAVLDDALRPVLVADGDGEEALQYFVAAPGTLHLAVRGQGAQDEERFQIAARGIPVAELGELILNSPATQAQGPALAQGQVAWFSLSTERLGSLLLEADAGPRADVALRLVRAPSVSVRGRLLGATLADEAGQGAPEALELPTAPTQWLLGVEALEGEGAPTVTASLLNAHPVASDDEPNDQPAEGVEAGTLDERPTFLVGGPSGDADAADHFRFTLTGAAEVELRAWPLDPDAASVAWLTLYEDREGNPEIAREEPALGFARLALPLGPGAYVAGVSGPAGLSGGYFVTAQVTRRLSCLPGQTSCSGDDAQICNSAGDGFLALTCNTGACRALALGDDCGARPEAPEPNEDASLATSIGDIGLGRAAILGRLGAAGDEDWYRFRLDRGGIVTVGTAPDAARPGLRADTALTVYNAQRNRVATADGGGVGAYAVLRDLSLPAGEYLAQVTVGASGQTGPYRLFVDRFDYFCPLGASRCQGATLEVCARGLAFDVEEVCAESCRQDGPLARCVSLGEPNDDPQAASPASPPLTFEAAIDRAGDEDWYELQADEPFELSATTSALPGGATVDTRVRLCAAANADRCTWDAGYEARNDDAQGPYAALSVFLPAAGTWYVVVDAEGSDTGDYIMDLREAAEPNDLPAQARALALMTPVQARIRPAADVDWYRLAVNGPDRLVIHTAPLEALDAVDLRLWLCAPDASGCSYAAGNLASDDNDGPGLYARLSYDFTQPGQYLIGVQGFGGRSGGYALLVEPDVEPNDSPDLATDIDLPALTPGLLDAPQDIDWLRFYGVAGEALVLETRPVEDGALVNTRAFLCDDANPAQCRWDGGNLTRADDGVFPQYSRLTWTLQRAANHYFVIEGVNGGQGDYLAFVNSASEPDDQPAQAQPIAVPGAFTGRLAPARDQDWFQINLAGPAFLQLQTAAPEGATPVTTRIFVCRAAQAQDCAYNAGDVARAEGSPQSPYARLFYQFPEGGRWFVAVEAADDQSVGHYSLQISGAGEPNDEPGAATRITAPGAGFGQLEPGDIDWFSWTTLEPLNLQLQTAPLGALPLADTRIWLCDSLSAQRCTWLDENLASDDDSGPAPGASRILAALDMPGTYLLGVEATTPGFYLLELTEQTEPNDRPQDAYLVNDSDFLQTRLWPAGDVDWYEVEIAGPAPLSFETEARPGAPEVDTRIWLCDPAAPSCSYDEGWLARGDDERGLYGALNWSFVTPGRYRFGVEAADGQSQGHYALRVREQGEPNDAPAQATALTLPARQPGRIAAEGEIDWYRFALTGASTLRFETRPIDGGVAVDTRLFLCVEQGVESCTYLTATLPRDDDSGRGLYSKLDVTFSAAGTYYVAVVGAGASVGNYELLASISPEPNDTAAQATQITTPLTIEADLSRATDQDWYQFEADLGDLLIFETSAPPGGDTVDTVIFLCDDVAPESCTSTGGNLAADDNGAPNFYSRLRYPFNTASGTFYLVVQSFGFRGGEYVLNITRPDEPNDDAAQATRLAWPAQREGRLNSALDQDWYVLTVPVGTTLTFETSAAPQGINVDTRIWLCDVIAPTDCTFAGGNLNSDDNSNGQYSRIRHTFARGGDHFLVIESASGDFGDYLLRVAR